MNQKPDIALSESAMAFANSVENGKVEVKQKIETSSKLFAVGVTLLMFYLMAMEGHILEGYSTLSCMLILMLNAIYIWTFVVIWKSLWRGMLHSKAVARGTFVTFCVIVLLVWSNYGTLERKFGPLITKDVQVPDYFFVTWQARVKEECLTNYESRQKRREQWLRDMSDSCRKEQQEHSGSLLSKWCVETFDKSPLPSTPKEPFPTSYTAWCAAAFSPDTGSTTSSHASGDANTITSSETASDNKSSDKDA